MPSVPRSTPPKRDRTSKPTDVSDRQDRGASRPRCPLLAWRAKGWFQPGARFALRRPGRRRSFRRDWEFDGRPGRRRVARGMACRRYQPADRQSAEGPEGPEQGAGADACPQKRGDCTRVYTHDPEEAELGAPEGCEGPSHQRLRGHRLHPGRGSQPPGALGGHDPWRPREGSAGRFATTSCAACSSHPGRQEPPSSAGRSTAPSVRSRTPPKSDAARFGRGRLIARPTRMPPASCSRRPAWGATM